ncbi:hypothetical protein A4R26_11965 [Niastella populi]|uniref:Uncharacterized protein n=1 Tax=Niastella populi TaxID=550983 RepID=A0A1V9GAW4_9BACT|nr:hypothetical protein A4R26_11965 [Niastella populi]
MIKEQDAEGCDPLKAGPAQQNSSIGDGKPGTEKTRQKGRRAGINNKLLISLWLTLKTTL